MIRLILHLFLFLFLSSYSCEAYRFSSSDQKVLNSFWKYAEEHRLGNLPVNERIPSIARFFLGTPYQSNTLNVTREELPVINLHELDCVTFVENVLALAFLEQYNQQSTEAFVQNIIRLRYRNAEIVDYTSRLHYSSDWLYEMQQAHLLTDITQFAGGIPYSKQICFMSEHSQKYPQLQKDSSLLKKIRTIETAINQRTYYYIPKDKINEACNKIKNGDIILITTHIKGLDTSHLGFAWKKEGKTIGLVPTMGYLHEGHASLIRRCREENDIVVVSDFVNPTQFGPNEDLEAYPRDFDRDSALCESIGADLIFCPSPAEMYHDPHAFVSIDTLSDTLCGKTRPIHFKGVCTVVSKLFNIVKPDRAYFGQKDAQQLAIIRKMVLDLNFDIKIVGCPIIREEDGLAKSSRNTYLSCEERKAALCLSKAVKKGQELIRNGITASEVLEPMCEIINSEPLARIDYVSMVDALSMQPVDSVNADVLVAMAVYIGKTRLIDNFSYEV